VQGWEKEDFHSEHEASAIRTIPVGTVTGMDVLKEVPTRTSAGLLGNDLPVAVLLELRADVAHHSTHVTDTEARTSLVGGESLTCGEVVNDPTLLGESVARHNVESPWMQG